MNQEENNHPIQSSSTFLKGALIGGLIGAAAALLFAPKPGNELRGDLSDKLSLVTDKTKEVASIVGDKASELAKTVSTKSSDVAKSVVEGTNNIVESVKSSSTDVSEELADVSKKVKDTSTEAAQDVHKELSATKY
ncbi:YtxH domain-containing protein [Paenibacillus crassostreae]|uniref:General stress protein n=1 Tax=Paenibacillus crassostreae TaxID=1763538 RepID=A0A167ETD0_9BACL|nr:YtxH domain-containing protein [Paenibacillus crassostreae]AOZ93485.1 general stress protein [Paenibacillus crassostreae]OAB75860.1 general stress protein [Paenibacillus crassostreae]